MAKSEFCKTATQIWIVQKKQMEKIVRQKVQHILKATGSITSLESVYPSFISNWTWETNISTFANIFLPQFFTPYFFEIDSFQQIFILRVIRSIILLLWFFRTKKQRINLFFDNLYKCMLRQNTCCSQIQKWRKNSNFFEKTVSRQRFETKWGTFV